MTAKPASTRKGKAPPALKALRRAAKNAVELARRTGTAAYVMVNGKIVDAAKPRPKTRKIRSSHTVLKNSPGSRDAAADALTRIETTP